MTIMIQDPHIAKRRQPAHPNVLIKFCLCFFVTSRQRGLAYDVIIRWRWRYDKQYVFWANVLLIIQMILQVLIRSTAFPRAISENQACIPPKAGPPRPLSARINLFEYFFWYKVTWSIAYARNECLTNSQAIGINSIAQWLGRLQIMLRTFSSITSLTYSRYARQLS